MTSQRPFARSTPTSGLAVFDHRQTDVQRASDRFESAMEVTELLEACLAHVQQPVVAPLPASLVCHTTVRSFHFQTQIEKGLSPCSQQLVSFCWERHFGKRRKLRHRRTDHDHCQVVRVSVDGKTITLEMPSENRGEEGKRTEIRITDKTEVRYYGVGLTAAKPTEGYHAQAWLQKGSTDNAAKVSFSVVDSTDRQDRLSAAWWLDLRRHKKITLEVPQGRDSTQSSTSR